jgi:AcrR family transcriptional regulator
VPAVPAASRPYHHGDLRAALVEQALELARADGPAGVSLREATRRAGVTPPAAYRHFRDRSHLLDAVARQIQERMAARMREGMATPSDAPPPERALQRLRGVGLGYIGFALEEPGWFETGFFGALREEPAPADGVGSRRATSAADGGGDGENGDGDGESGEGTGAGPSATVPPFRLLVEALDQCVEAGVLAPARRPGAEFVCWSAVHGFAELVLHGPLHGAPPAMVQQLAGRVVEDAITGIR